MDLVVAGLVLGSAALHPLWFALVKRDPDPEAAYLALLAVMAAIALAHAAAAGVDLVAALAAWPLILLSTASQVVYGAAVVMVLRRGDLSAYYPIIRSSPLAIVAIGFAVLGETYPAAMLLGIALVLAGGFVLQRKPDARLLAQPAVLGLAALAMLMVALYSIADARLVGRIHPAAVMFWCQTPPILALALFYRRDHPEWRGLLPVGVWARAPLRYLRLGPIAYGSYYMILLAYAAGGNVAAVNAVRQIAIPISVLIGGMWLAESQMWRRLAAALVLAAGIVAIVLSR